MSNTAIADHAILSDRHSTAFAGEQGTFLLCTFWPAEALALAHHQVDRTRNVFERTAAFANDLGLLPEKSTQRPVGYSATSPRHLATSASV
jgi:GH15 family glucan-1,4-alpha-glucosidase